MVTQTTARRRSPRGPMKFGPKRHFGRAPRFQASPEDTTQKSANLRIIPLGGLEEVGRNMTVFEYGQDIVIVDLGLQFPEEDMPGIDYIIPNVSYLQGKEKNILGVFITHAHYDHIGAIPHLMAKLGNPTLYMSELSRGIVMRRQDDFKECPKLDIQVVTKDDKVKLGNFEVEFFHVNHNIPGGLGIKLNTPGGSIVHTGDFKFDHSPIADKPADISRLAQIGGQNVLALMSDSCNADAPGHTISELTIQENLETIFKMAPGRMIIATFASLLSRVQSIITLAEKYGRKVAIDGYSMRMNVEIAKELGYLKFEKGTLIQSKDINRHPANKVVLMCTGAQGEDNAVLMRIANHDHRSVHIEKGDTVIFSSSVVPGNERTVQNLKDILVRQGAKIYHSKYMDIHASGHGQQEDLKMMLNLIKPKYFIPVHGNYYMLRQHAEIAESVGINPENIVVSGNGNIINLTPEKIWMDKTKVPTSYVMVDGLGVGDVGQVVLRDRQAMAKDGMFVIIVTVDAQTGKVRNSPDIISRGFIYMRESKELLYQVREKVKDIVHHSTGDQASFNGNYIKENIREKIGQFLYTRTQRRPMVLPVLIEV